MSQPSDLINRFPVADPKTILRSLAEYAQKFSLWSIDKFEVTLLLCSGHVVSGKAARMGTDLGGECVLLYQGDEKDPSLVYLRLNDVIAVRISNPMVASRVFTAQQQKVRAGVAPTRLEHKRMLEATNKELAAGQLPSLECIWESVGDSPEEQFNLADLIPAAASALRGIAADPLGSDALKKILTVTMRSVPGAALHVTKNGPGVDLSCDLRRLSAEDFNTELVSAFEKSL